MSQAEDNKHAEAQLQETEGVIGAISNAGHKMTSVQAAALFLSGGQTDDPQEAEALTAGGALFNMDAMQRAHLRRMMGFDFEIRIAPNKLHVYSREAPLCSTWCRYEGIVDEKTVDGLVDACLRLKIKWDKRRAALKKAGQL